MVFNFGFDCSLAPVAGRVHFDAARLGPGEISVGVDTQTPAIGPTSVGTVTYVGTGCGTPLPVLVASGTPSIPNAGFSLQALAAPHAGMIAAYSFGQATLPIGPGCFQFLDPQTLGVHGFLAASGLGIAHLAFPIPNGIPPFTVHWQFAVLQPGGPVLGDFAVTNAVKLEATVAPGNCQ
jgi:hypothetical protein